MDYVTYKRRQRHFEWWRQEAEYLAGQAGPPSSHDEVGEGVGGVGEEAGELGETEEMQNKAKKKQEEQDIKHEKGLFGL